MKSLSNLCYHVRFSNLKPSMPLGFPSLQKVSPNCRVAGKEEKRAGKTGEKNKCWGRAF